MSAQPHFQVVSILDEEPVLVLGGSLDWVPLRRRLGIGAFGTNAYRAAREGDVVIEAHDESTGQEELYVVLTGRARFAVGGDEFDAPAGTALFLPQPGGLAGRHGARGRHGRARGRRLARAAVPLAALGADLPRPGVDAQRRLGRGRRHARARGGGAPRHGDPPVPARLLSRPAGRARPRVGGAAQGDRAQPGHARACRARSSTSPRCATSSSGPPCSAERKGCRPPAGTPS